MYQNQSNILTLATHNPLTMFVTFPFFHCLYFWNSNRMLFSSFFLFVRFCTHFYHFRVMCDFLCVSLCLSIREVESFRQTHIQNKYFFCVEYARVFVMQYTNWSNFNQYFGSPRETMPEKVLFCELPKINYLRFEYIWGTYISLATGNRQLAAGIDSTSTHTPYIYRIYNNIYDFSVFAIPGIQIQMRDDEENKK